MICLFVMQVRALQLAPFEPHAAHKINMRPPGSQPAATSSTALTEAAAGGSGLPLSSHFLLNASAVWDRAAWHGATCGAGGARSPECSCGTVQGSPKMTQGVAWQG